MPIRLCLAATRFHPAYAGPSVRFKRYAPGLRERDVLMRVFSAAWANQNGTRSIYRNGMLLPAEVIDGIPVQRVQVSSTDKSMAMAYARALYGYCQAEDHKPDVIQYLDLSPWSVPWLRRLRRLGIPQVYTRTMVRDPSVHWLKNILWKVPYRFFDCVVVSTGVMELAMRELGIRGRIEVIPNGVDLERFRPIESPGARWKLRHKLGLDPHAQIIMFVGGFVNYRKGTDVLAATWSMIAPQCPKAQLVIVGPRFKEAKLTGPQGEFLARVELELQRSGARDRVVFTGEVECVEDYLRAADIFVFPSRREGMPNVVPEAFGCGVPSILTPFIGLPTEFGRPGREYILVDRTPEKLAAAISGLLDNLARRRSLSARARRWVEHELNVEKSLDRYTALYRELVEQSRRRRNTHPVGLEEA